MLLAPQCEHFRTEEEDWEMIALQNGALKSKHKFPLQ